MSQMYAVICLHPLHLHNQTNATRHAGPPPVVRWSLLGLHTILPLPIYGRRANRQRGQVRAASAQPNKRGTLKVLCTPK